MAYIVCIDGNIAAGKTTVLQEIEKKGYPVYYEPFQDNPWLHLYYKAPSKYALNTQIWFLSERYRQYKNADFSTRKIVFVERSIYTDRFVFVELIKQQGNLDELEVDTYKHHFEICKNPRSGAEKKQDGRDPAALRILGVLSALALPLPVPDLRQVDAVVPDILAVLHQLVIHLLHQIGAPVAQLG